MAFSEAPRFPDDISQGSSGGPRYNTKVVATQAGFEDRRVLWSSVRHQYNAGYGMRSDGDIYEVLAFFHAMNGRAHEFRFKDWSDYKSGNVADAITVSDQTIGNGDGTTAAFQLKKTYTKGLSYVRTINKPVSGTIRLAIGGIESTTNFSAATTTGIVTIDDITRTVTLATTTNPIQITTSANHGLVAGDTAYLSTFTGDWSALNGARYAVTIIDSDTFTVAVDGTGFTSYSSNGGQLDTVPQSGEAVTAGFEFDVPVRFDTDEMDVNLENYLTGSTDLPIIEVRL